MNSLPYFSIELFFNKTEDVADLFFPVDVYLQAINAFSVEIKSHNFNKYFGPNRSPIIALRVKTENQSMFDEVTKSVCSRMVSEHRIASFSGQSLIWTEPEFVQTAHDTGTKLAVEFVSELRKNQLLLEKLRQKPDWFLFHYLLLTLQKSNFDIPTVWGDMRESVITDEEIGGLTDASAKILSTAISTVSPTSSFLERVIHAFQNCTTQQFESQIANRFFVFLLWKHMSDSLKKS